MFNSIKLIEGKNIKDGVICFPPEVEWAGKLNEQRWNTKWCK